MTPTPDPTRLAALAAQLAALGLECEIDNDGARLIAVLRRRAIEKVDAARAALLALLGIGPDAGTGVGSE